jgi:adenylate cyclase
MGDGLLVEFASVVDALACAVAWQDGVAAQEAVVDDDTRLTFRIGINPGDVIVEGDDIHGDGVNIAARLEALAEPGGICLSGDAYRQAKGKLEAAFEDMGEQDLKTVAEPVRVYRVAAGRSVAAAPSPKTEAPALPHKPSVAVLPFEELGGDPGQTGFSEGLAANIITELSRFGTIRRRASREPKPRLGGCDRSGRRPGPRRSLCAERDDKARWRARTHNCRIARGGDRPPAMVGAL